MKDNRDGLCFLLDTDGIRDEHSNGGNGSRPRVRNTAAVFGAVGGTAEGPRGWWEGLLRSKIDFMLGGLSKIRKTLLWGVKVAALLKKVKTMDVALLTVAERTDFLALAHAALLHNTDFFSSLMHLLDTEYSQDNVRRRCAVYNSN